MQNPSMEPSPENQPVGGDTAPRVLLVVDSRCRNGDPLEKWLRSAGARPGPDLAALGDELGAAPDLYAVLLYANPAIDVAQSLDAGAEPALDNLAAAMGEVLSVYRAHRRQLTLVDIDAARAHPGALRDWLGDRLEWSSSMPEAGEASMPTPLALAVARTLLRDDERLGALLAELEASSLPLPSPAAPAVAGLLEALAGAREAVEQQAEAPEPVVDPAIQEEKALLMLQLERVQKALESQLTANRGLERRVQELADRPGPEELDALHERLKWTAQDLESVRNSLSWKLTAPLRKLLGLFKGHTEL